MAVAERLREEIAGGWRWISVDQTDLVLLLDVVDAARLYVTEEKFELVKALRALDAVTAEEGQ